MIYDIETDTMTRLEAQRIAFDPLHTWPCATLHKAAVVLSQFAREGRDAATYVQLASLKAEAQRYE